MRDDRAALRGRLHYASAAQVFSARALETTPLSFPEEPHLLIFGN
jgi:hypothetical protein